LLLPKTPFKTWQVVEGFEPLGITDIHILCSIMHFGLRFQRVAATQASNFFAGVWYCQVFLGLPLVAVISGVQDDDQRVPNFVSVARQW